MMRRRWRWAAVAVALAALCAAPAVVAARPAPPDSPVSAATLLAKVQNSSARGYSGYAEASGGLGLPVTNQFSSVSDLLGGTSQLRVWWRGSSDWRVDAISLSGESDVHQNGGAQWTWDYESNEATLTQQPSPPAVRLPTSSDLLPTTLARRLLSEADAAEVTRIGPRRIAGHTALGIRLRPSESGSTIDSVDVWVDPGSGLALAVDVRGGGQTVMSTRFLEFSSITPAEAATRFTPPPGAQQRVETDPDIAALIDRIGLAQVPGSLAGVTRNDQLPPVGSIGVYGRGVTEFVASPLFGRLARQLRDQLDQTAGVTRTASGQLLTIGPLALLLTSDGPGQALPGRFGGTAWLLVGTVTSAILDRAATELLTAQG